MPKVNLPQDSSAGEGPMVHARIMKVKLPDGTSVDARSTTARRALGKGSLVEIDRTDVFWSALFDDHLGYVLERVRKKDRGRL